MREIKYVSLDEIAGAHHNPKQHDTTAIGRSIGRFGLADPPVIDERTGQLVSGHGRIEVLRTMRDAGQDPPDGISTGDDGQWLVPVYCGWASRSDSEASAYLVAANRLTEIGGWDHDSLARLLDSIGDPDLAEITGWDPGKLADLLDGGEEMPEAGDADAITAEVTWGVTVTCRDEQQQLDLLERLSDEGYAVRKL